MPDYGETTERLRKAAALCLGWLRDDSGMDAAIDVIVGADKVMRDALALLTEQEQELDRLRGSNARLRGKPVADTMHTDYARRTRAAFEVLERDGYRFCDTAVCSCGNWHRHD